MNITVQDKARIAVYDDMLSAPRVIDIQPQGVAEFIEAIAASVYELSHQQGGSLPYTAIREITENFIHAGFLECTVSILDSGNTLRFADQGPGITKKDLVLRPGVSSATSKMKEYIRGVGSGFPIVKEYLATSHGYMSIEDNAEDGTVITLSLVPDALLLESSQPAILKQAPVETKRSFEAAYVLTAAGPVFQATPENVRSSSPAVPQSDGEHTPLASFSEREERALLLLKEHGMLGPVDLAELLGISAPTATRLLQRMERLGMVESTQLKKRILSNLGLAYIQDHF